MGPFEAVVVASDALSAAGHTSSIAPSAPSLSGTFARTHPASPHTPRLAAHIVRNRGKAVVVTEPYRLVTRTRTRTMFRKGSAKVVTPRLRLCGRRRSTQASRHEG